MASAAEIVDGEFSRIMKRTQKGIEESTYSVIDLPSCSEYEETIVLVIHFIGLAGGMGFEHLFTDEIDGDPEYRRTIKAFERIGAKSACLILNEIVNQYFPKAKPSGNVSDRRRVATRLENRFCKLENLIVQDLSEYITRNKADG